MIEHVESNTVELWLCQISRLSKASKDRFQAVLNSLELEKQARFHFDKDRERYMITRGMVRYVLSHYVSDIAPNHWRFAENEYGKPCIAGEHACSQLQFNVSHSGDYIAMAFAATSCEGGVPNIGIDIEAVVADKATRELAQYSFSEHEFQEFEQRIIDENFENCFFDYWTLKESYIKVIGKGLNEPLKGHSFSLSEEGNIEFSIKNAGPGSASAFQFRQYSLTGSSPDSLTGNECDVLYKLALALKNNAPDCINQVRCFRLNAKAEPVEHSLKLERRS